MPQNTQRAFSVYPGLPDFSLYDKEMAKYQNGENIPNAPKINKLKLCQITIKYTTVSIPRPSSERYQI
jgi:hypothetical protein